MNINEPIFMKFNIINKIIINTYMNSFKFGFIKNSNRKHVFITKKSHGIHAGEFSRFTRFRINLAI